MNISGGSKIVFLTLGGYDYIGILNDSIGPFMLFPGGNTVVPGIEYWEATQATSCQVEAQYYIRDVNNNQLVRLFGTRPANIIRR